MTNRAAKDRSNRGRKNGVPTGKSRLEQSRFAQRFNLATPIALAPMAGASGGELAAACAKAGVAAGDFTRAHLTVGEGTGLIRGCASAGEVIAAMITAEARALLG